MNNRNSALTPAKEIAYLAVSSALLICAQLALSAVPGVEVVTALFVCLSFVFGARFGVFLGIAFSLLRCIIFGVYPTVVILYAIYFPLLGLIFGCLGRVKEQTWKDFPLWFAVAVNAVLIALCCVCAVCAALNLIKISRLYAGVVKVLLWVICGLSGCALIAFDLLYYLKKRGICRVESGLKLLFVTVLAAVCTVCFTLLDDVITPLLIGMTAQGAIAYFYSSFIAMLPQTICAAVSVLLTFYPLTAILNRIAK